MIKMKLYYNYIKKSLMKNQKGQIILVLVLVMTVALAIGISVIQRSISDVSTASKVEQSSRAFSAAEAGIEKALRGDFSSVNFPENNSQAVVSGQGLLPAVPITVSLQGALSYPPLSKDEVAQIWLADYTSATNPPPAAYKQTSLDVYWGDPSATTDQAALELTVVYYDGSKYVSRRWFLDQIPRTPPNGFCQASTCAGYTVGSTAFQCKFRLGDSSTCANNGALPSNLMLLRARLLYNTTSQPFAVQAVGNCGPGDTDACIPAQASVVTSIGTAGTTQRKVQVFTLGNVVPPYFDYAIFSTGTINK